MLDGMTATALSHLPVNLLRIGKEAWSRWPHEPRSRREFVSSRLRGDLWDLIEIWQPASLTQVVGWLLNRAQEAMAAERPDTNVGAKPTGTRGQSVTVAHTGTAPRVTALPVAGRKPVSDGGHATVATQKVAAPVALKPWSPSPRHAETIATKLTVHGTLSKLDTFPVNGRPIGDCTPHEVRDWLPSRHRDCRFAEMLISGIPDDMQIRKCIRPDEADKIFLRAGAEHAA